MCSEYETNGPSVGRTWYNRTYKMMTGRIFYSLTFITWISPVRTSTWLISFYGRFFIHSNSSLERTKKIENEEERRGENILWWLSDWIRWEPGIKELIINKWHGSSLGLNIKYSAASLNFSSLFCLEILKNSKYQKVFNSCQKWWGEGLRFLLLQETGWMCRCVPEKKFGNNNNGNH